MGSLSENIITSLDEVTWDNYISVSTELTKINGGNIEFELLNHSRIYSYYQGFYSIIKSKLEDAEIKLDSTIAITRQTEQEKRENVGKRATDKYLEDCVKSSTDYITQKQKVNELRYKANLIKSLLNSLEHKKDCLIQLSANSRAETRLITG